MKQRTVDLVVIGIISPRTRAQFQKSMRPSGSCASCLIIRRPSGGHSNIFMVEAADAFERNHPPLLRRLDRPAFRCALI